jgi:Bifunctional DNA primase/polymerase, N-terminal
MAGNELVAEGGRLGNGAATAALEYAEHGWPVLPLRPGAKIPATTRGLHDATVDLELVEQWWTERPDCNLGLRTGDWFDVLDIDGPDGMNALADHVADDFQFPGPVVWTPKGVHCYFQPTGLGNRARFAPGLDWRGVGGYAVAPPSWLETGTYTWWQDEQCADQLQPVPDWLLELLNPPAPAKDRHPFAQFRHTGGTSYAMAALENEAHAVATAPVGTRNHQLNKSAYAVARLDLDRGDIERVLLAAALDAGLSQHEAERTIRSGIDGRSA